MKFEKFISISLCNASLFLVFASIITSCQKKNFEKYGHFSHISAATRTPASATDDKLEEFYKKYQDPNQVYVYCALNSPKTEDCYNHHTNKVMTNFVKKHGPMTEEKLNQLKARFSYQNTHNQIKNIQSLILDKVDPELYQLISKRSQFCEKNSTLNLKRCLSQFKNKDTLKVLNSYQSKTEKLNAHEYLYVQNFLQAEVEKRLNFELDKIKNPTSYDHKDAQTGNYHL